MPTLLLVVGSIGATEALGEEDVPVIPHAQNSAQQLKTADKARPIRPISRTPVRPAMRWDHRDEAALWTRGTLAVMHAHGKPLITMVPRDIDTWCPAYAQGDAHQRAAFWVGFMSALSKHESTYKPHAVGGGGLWYGLLQILPATARGYGCRARSGTALKNGNANLSCAARIMAVTVLRDGVIAQHNGRWRGVAADWGPMTNRAKRKDMASWLRRQTYCRPLSFTRPRPRPAELDPDE